MQKAIKWPAFELCAVSNAHPLVVYSENGIKSHFQ